MSDTQQDANIVFVNLLREERETDANSIIDRSLRSIERYAKSRAFYEKINDVLEKIGVPRDPQGNAALHDQVEAFKNSLKPGECGVIAHGNSFSVFDDRKNTDPRYSQMTALGLEKVLKDNGCTPDMPVILYSCNTGTGKESLAAELSKYHPTVVAPDGVIAEFITSSKPGIYVGNEQTGQIDNNSPRQWKVFSHGKEIASYDWGSEAIHKPVQQPDLTP